MKTRLAKRVVQLILLAEFWVGSESWSQHLPVYHVPRLFGGIGRPSKKTWLSSSSTPRDGDDYQQLNPQQSNARREQELILEASSLRGAAIIANMEITERAKRAMLAEAIEDRVFELTDQLERMLEEDGSVKIENRKEVEDTARQTKELQLLYSDLVNGKPSALLNAITSLTNEENEN